MGAYCYITNFEYIIPSMINMMAHTIMNIKTFYFCDIEHAYNNTMRKIVNFIIFYFFQTLTSPITINLATYP
ncbi:hypothetical protein B6I39_28335 [Klebsiella quasipneumoniae]|nr:hypothetical protein B6I39_28335 [Klebsiella quasipneumoniae]